MIGDLKAALESIKVISDLLKTNKSIAIVFGFWLLSKNISISIAPHLT